MRKIFVILMVLMLLVSLAIVTAGNGNADPKDRETWTGDNINQLTAEQIAKDPQKAKEPEIWAKIDAIKKNDLFKTKWSDFKDKANDYFSAKLGKTMGGLNSDSVSYDGTNLMSNGVKLSAGNFPTSATGAEATDNGFKFTYQNSNSISVVDGADVSQANNVEFTDSNGKTTIEKDKVDLGKGAKFTDGGGNVVSTSGGILRSGSAELTLSNGKIVAVDGKNLDIKGTINGIEYDSNLDDDKSLRKVKIDSSHIELRGSAPTSVNDKANGLNLKTTENPHAGIILDYKNGKPVDVEVRYGYTSDTFKTDRGTIAIGSQTKPSDYTHVVIGADTTKVTCYSCSLEQGNTKYKTVGDKRGTAIFGFDTEDNFIIDMGTEFGTKGNLNHKRKGTGQDVWEVTDKEGRKTELEIDITGRGKSIIGERGDRDFKEAKVKGGAELSKKFKFGDGSEKRVVDATTAEGGTTIIPEYKDEAVPELNSRIIDNLKSYENALFLGQDKNLVKGGLEEGKFNEFRNSEGKTTINPTQVKSKSDKSYLTLNTDKEQNTRVEVGFDGIEIDKAVEVDPPQRGVTENGKVVGEKTESSSGRLHRFFSSWIGDETYREPQKGDDYSGSEVVNLGNLRKSVSGAEQEGVTGTVVSQSPKPERGAGSDIRSHAYEQLGGSKMKVTSTDSTDPKESPEDIVTQNLAQLRRPEDAEKITNIKITKKDVEKQMAQNTLDQQKATGRNYEKDIANLASRKQSADDLQKDRQAILPQRNWWEIAAGAVGLVSTPTSIPVAVELWKERSNLYYTSAEKQQDAINYNGLLKDIETIKTAYPQKYSQDKQVEVGGKTTTFGELEKELRKKIAELEG